MSEALESYKSDMGEKAARIVAFGELVRVATADADALGKGDELRAELKAVLPIFKRDGQKATILRSIRKVLGWNWTQETGLARE